MLGLGIDLPNRVDRKPWSPTDINGLALYLKNGRATAAQWDDSSGNANHAAQSSSGSQATCPASVQQSMCARRSQTSNVS